MIEFFTGFIGAAVFFFLTFCVCYGVGYLVVERPAWFMSRLYKMLNIDYRIYSRHGEIKCLKVFNIEGNKYISISSTFYLLNNDRADRCEENLEVISKGFADSVRVWK